MKIKVGKDERYPDYYIVNDYGTDVEITDEELEFIKKADKLYSEAQNILSRAYNKK